MRRVLFAVGVLMTATVSLAHAATLTGAELSGLTTQNCGTCSSSISGGVITLTSSDNVGGGGYSQFLNTATVYIPSGYGGTTSLGTLGNFLSLYTSDVNFNVSSATAQGGQYAYWNVELTTAVGPTTYTAVLNAFGDNTPVVGGIAANPWNSQTSTGYDQSGNQVSYGFGSTWTAAELTSLDGVQLSDWTVTALTISVGGWDTNTNGTGDQTDTINSITLPGTFTETPIPAALPLFTGGLGMLGLLGWRRKRKTAAVAAA